MTTPTPTTARLEQILGLYRDAAYGFAAALDAQRRRDEDAEVEAIERASTALASADDLERHPE